MKLPSPALVLAAALVAGGAPALAARHGLDDELRLNQIQVIGTHNSYHVAPRSPLVRLFAGAAQAWEYTHLPLEHQLALGVRQLELDVFADPAGGRFARPVARAGPRSFPPELRAALELPGFKVLHVPDVDFESTCASLRACLASVRAWSDAHRAHLPLLVLIEVKDEGVREHLARLELDLPFTEALAIGPAELDALDGELRAVFPPERLITPDDVRGARATLEEAVLADGWPTLRAARGRLLFAIDNGGRARELYLAGHPSLEGRVMFTDSRPGTPEAAFAKLNDPIADQAEIQSLVARGFLVRTRADADTSEARSGDATRREAALASGAQFVSTDYPVPDPALPTGYCVRLPNRQPARCNPINAGHSAGACDSAALEDVAPPPAAGGG